MTDALQLSGLESVTVALMKWRWSNERGTKSTPLSLPLRRLKKV